MAMYMIIHKMVSFIPKGRVPIFVGNGNNKKFLGDNISNKNRKLQ